MDAAQRLLKNYGLLFVIALLMAAPGWAQPTLQVQTAVTIGNTGSASASVSSSAAGTTEITYTIGAPNYSNDSSGSGSWLVVSGGTVTPAVLNFGLRNNTTAGINSNATATVTLTPTAPSGVAAVTITVSFSGSGSGTGNGNLVASPNPLFISANANSAAAPATVSISTTGGAVTIASVTTSLITGTNVNWLSAQIVNGSVGVNSNGSITVTANSTGLTSGLSYLGTVTVTPSAGSPLNISVNFSVGSGGGSGNWQVSPSTIGWSFTTNSGTFLSQSVSVTPPSGATYYNIAIPACNNGWLLGSVGGSTGNNFNGIALGTAFGLQVTSQANALTTGQYSCSVSLTDSLGNSYSLPVTLTVNGGTSSGFSISPNPLTFNSAVNGATQSQLVTMSSNTGGTATVGPYPNAPSWLTATAPNPVSVGANQATTFTVTANPAGMVAGTYSAAIPVGIGSQSGTVTVNLVIGSGGTGGGTTAVAPTSMNFTYQFGASAATIPKQKLVITGPAGSWSSAISTGSTWLQLTPGGGSALPNPAVSGDTPIVSINPTGLAVGSYSGNINITTSGGSQLIQVSLSVVSGATLVPNPGSLIFSAQTGQGNPTPQNVFFSGSDNSLNPISISAISNTSWITLVVGATGVGVYVDQTNLSTGVYNGSFSVSQSGASNSPLVVPVVLVVNGGGSGGGTGTLTFSQNPIPFSSINGTVTPSSTVLSVTAVSATSFVGTINYVTGCNSGCNWLSVSPLSSVTPVNLAVSANSTGLAAGNYSANISFNTNGSIQTVGVTLAVTTSGGGNTGNVTASPTSLTFSTAQGSSPAAQALNVQSASGSAPVSFTVVVTAGSTWLSTSANASNTTPAALTVSVSSNAMQAGTYTGNIRITPSGGTIVDVPVSLTITAPPTVSATPTTLTFNYRAGDSAPASQPISVSGGGASLAYTATASSTGNWLVVSPTSGTTPGTVNASVNTSGLTTGVFSGTIIVAGASGAPGSTTITVTLNVTAPLPTITKVTNAASYSIGSVSPGEIITLFAGDPAHPIGPATAVGLSLDSTGSVSTSIGGVSVTVNGFACPMVYASASQVSAVVPYQVKSFVTATIQSKFLGQSSNGVLANVVTTVPGVFTANSSGSGPGAILNQNSTTNSPSNPAARGDTVVVYLTGEGETSPAGVTGKVTTVAAPPQPLTPAPLLPISVTVGGQPAQYSFAGEAPGFVSGVLQLNVVTPTNIAAGDQPIVVTIGGNQSQQGVTVSLR
jgi:uncharacterized protein (TIGR03437 family)